jgi:hypothetical protein
VSGYWIALAVLILLLVGVSAAAMRRRVPAESATESEAMPLPMQAFLVPYLLGLAIALLYLTFKLFALDFPETPLVLEVPGESTVTGTSSAQGADQQGEKAQQPGTAAPRLLRAFPHSTVGSAPTLQLTLQGSGFDPRAKVRINGRERTALWLADNLIQVTPHQEDVVGVGSLSADVMNPNGGISNALTISVVRPRLNLRAFGGAWPISREVQLLVLVLCAGALGSYVHALKSFSDYLGNRSLTRSWFVWYLSRPFLGMVLAFIFYAVLRGGFLTGTPADVRVVNPFGAIAVAALVGMFADKAAQKLAEIFDAFFKGEDLRRDKLEQSTVPALQGTLPEGKAGTAYTHEIKAVGGAPPYEWTIAGAPTWLKLDPKTGKLTGTPAAADVGTAKVTVTVRDAKGATSSKALDLIVKA